MPSCLGLYIENNLIKYAKVTKEKDMLRVDSFGVKFYDQIGFLYNILSQFQCDTKDVASSLRWIM